MGCTFAKGREVTGDYEVHAHPAIQRVERQKKPVNTEINGVTTATFKEVLKQGRYACPKAGRHSR